MLTSYCWRRNSFSVPSILVARYNHIYKHPYTCSKFYWTGQYRRHNAVINHNKSVMCMSHLYYFLEKRGKQIALEIRYFINPKQHNVNESSVVSTQCEWVICGILGKEISNSIRIRDLFYWLEMQYIIPCISQYVQYRLICISFGRSWRV